MDFAIYSRSIIPSRSTIPSQSTTTPITIRTITIIQVDQHLVHVRYAMEVVDAVVLAMSHFPTNIVAAVGDVILAMVQGG